VGNLARTTNRDQSTFGHSCLQRPTWECFHKHWESLSRHVQLGSSLHHRQNFADNWVMNIRYPPSKSNDRYNTCSISFQMLLVQFWRAKNIVRNKHTFVILERAIVADLLESNTHMGQFSMYAPSRTVIHGNQICLTCSKFAKYNHTGS